mmetsp:Transcript_28595/g.32686  ORF Transcript_28595/g.32686 Transcript_28595/m.32686 type:complete len:448 (+) Transcript_28595:40-1383(+)
MDIRQALFLGFVALSLLHVEVTGESDLIKTTLQSALDSYGESGYFTGLQFSYLPPGTDASLSSTVGFKSVQKKQPVSAETLFGWGSITKEFVNAVLFTLESEYSFALTDTLFQLLPEFFDNGENSWPKIWKDIKLYQVLNMTSGIPDYLDILILGVQQGKYKTFEDLIKMPWTFTEIMALVAEFQKTQLSECEKLKYCFEPGTKYNYSNTDYMLAGLLIEHLTGNTVLNLLDSIVYIHVPSDGIAYYEGGASPKPEVRDQMAQGYSDIAVSGIPLGADGTKWPFYLEGPAGGMIGNTAALNGLVKALFGGKIVSEEITRRFLYDYLVNLKTGELVTDPEKECTDYCYGLGIFYQYSPTYGGIYLYGGQPLVYWTMYIYLPCFDLSVSLSKNSSSLASEPLIESLHTQLENIKQINPQIFQNEISPSFCPSKTQQSELNFLSDEQPQV